MIEIGDVVVVAAAAPAGAVAVAVVESADDGYVKADENACRRYSE